MAIPTQSPATLLEDDSMEVIRGEAGLELIDRQARNRLGMSGEAFMQG
jgi:cell division protein FtsB